MSDTKKFQIVVDWHDDSTARDRIGGKYIEVGSEDDLRENLETIVGQAIVMQDGMGYADLRIKIRPVSA